MKKIILGIAALVALSAGATPAMAQSRGSNFDNRIEVLQQQIERGVERRSISRQEAKPLRDRSRELAQLERRYSRGGFTKAEQRTLRQRVQRLEQQIQAARSNRR